MKEDKERITQQPDMHYDQTEKYINSSSTGQPVPEHVPENPVDTAHILLSNSPLTALMPEMDKEVKLSNLDSQEKWAVYQFISVWHDMLWLRKQQTAKLREYDLLYKQDLNKLDQYSQEDLILESISEEDAVFDQASNFRKGMFVVELSRGKYGFEREKQVQTISNYKMETNDKSETPPGFIKKYMGGLKK